MQQQAALQQAAASPMVGVVLALALCLTSPHKPIGTISTLLQPRPSTVKRTDLEPGQVDYRELYYMFFKNAIDSLRGEDASPASTFCCIAVRCPWRTALRKPALCATLDVQVFADSQLRPFFEGISEQVLRHKQETMMEMLFGGAVST